jgi:hypothetical protein
MAALVWAGMEVRSAADRQRTAVRQAAALTGLVAAGVLWLAATPSDPLVFSTTVLAAAAAVAELVWALLSRERMNRAADALILDGYEPHGRDDEVSTAVRRRTNRLLGSDRKLVITQLRFQAGLTGGRQTAYRAPVANYPLLLERIADSLEHGRTDPRAVILLERLLSEPAPETFTLDRTGRTVEQRLLEVLALLTGDTAGRS